ncbi:MAG: NAD(P)H-hydrate epimerase [candidate division NC10 bacterium]|nr:NAD(P)H-hydrate epimerase [candidate division NC10 bacterium]
MDRLMVEKYGIQLLQMMENAGRNLAELSRGLLGNSVLDKHVIVAAGKGNNGGGGMVAARHLYNWGARVTIVLESEGLSGVPTLQWKVLKALPVEKQTGEEALQSLSGSKADLVIDALIGYGLSGKPRGLTARMIEKINTLSVPVVSLDVPSGLDATTGEIHDPCIRATATMTLALPKTGLVKPEARNVVGALYLADISVPDVVYREMGLRISPIFIHDTLIRIEEA